MVKLKAKEGKLVLFLDKFCYHSSENCWCSSIWLYTETLVLCGAKEARRAVRNVVPPACPGGSAWGGYGEGLEGIALPANGRACFQ